MRPASAAHVRSTSSAASCSSPVAGAGSAAASRERSSRPARRRHLRAPRAGVGAGGRRAHGHVLPRRRTRRRAGRRVDRRDRRSATAGSTSRSTTPAAPHLPTRPPPPPKFSTSIVALNLLAPLFVAQAANAVMQRQDDGGLIINIGSVSGMRPSPSTAAYGAAKAGLVNLTETLAVEWGPKVRVNHRHRRPRADRAVAALVRRRGGHRRRRRDRSPPAAWPTRPTSATPACLLASPLARYISGANLAVHGGGERPAYLAASQGDINRGKG